MTDLFSTHRETLEAAVEATRSREYYSAFNESPSPRVYGETAAADGQAAFEAWRGTTFPLDVAGSEGTVAGEKSPFGFELDVSYPRVSPSGVDDLLAASVAGLTGFRDAGPAVRAGVCLEILHRLHGRIFELANAVQHTSGQAFVMAFQAGGAHALDRALEAVAYAYAEMTRVPSTVVWEKPGRGEPLRLEKTFTAVPRGVALVIGCNTFPTWNSYPGLSRHWRAATRSSSSRTPGPYSRWPSPSRSPRRCSPKAASTLTSSPSRPRTRPTGWPPYSPSARR